MSLPFDVDGFVKNYEYPLQLVQSGEMIARDGQSVTLRCATTQFNRRWRDRYGTWVEIGVPGAAGDDMLLKLEFVTPYIIRARVVAGDILPENHTPMLVEDYAPQMVDAACIEDEQGITLKSSALSLTIQRKPWRIIIQDAQRFPLFETLPAQVYQHPPTGESHLDGASITDAWPWFFRDMFPLGFIQDSSGLTQTFFTATIRHDEHFYGFGEKFGTLDKRGQAINLWHANATGNTWPTSYKNVPFFLSSRGYGLFVNSAYPIKYHMGDLSHTHYSVHLQDGLMDFFFIYGPTMKEILPRYTDITGKPALPPLWSFGLWMSRMSYREQTEVETVAAQLREKDVPCDVIHIDTDWFKTPWVNDLSFSQERFPDPRAMIARLREQGYHLTLWQLPYIATQSAFFDEGVENGYFAKRDDGTPWMIDGFFGQAAVIDYSNPDAVKWIKSKFDTLFEMGVAAIKTDFGEGAPHEAHYAHVSGLEMHNLYPLLYNRAVWEKTKEATGEGIVWGRSVYAGSQRYPMHWGGDPAALWGDLGNLWHGGLGLGLCGFPFWSVDIGGFGGTPTPELYIRWAEAGLFVTHPRAHGPIHREPWAFGEQALDIFRRYAKLRYRLMHYVWSSANTCVLNSTPVMRPLVLDWQDDPTVAGIDDQFMFGEWLMVAPIVDEGQQRKVYLPQGVWYDFWTKARIDCTDGGKWLSVDAPLDMLPLYVRGGAIIPTCADAPHTGVQDWTRITLDVYPDGESAFDFYDKDGSLNTLYCSEQAGQVIVTVDAGHEYQLRAHKTTQVNLVKR
jgi:alpha-D-xyloside xylohydrolase